MSVKEYCSVYSGATGGAVAQFGEVMSLRNLKCNLRQTEICGTTCEQGVMSSEL